MSNEHSEQTVLVTGATGYIALHCQRELLERGYKVRGTMRSLSREGEVREALASAPGATDPGRLSFFEADLTKDENWAEAVAGCDYVLHVASPLPLEEPEDENELIQPACEGVLRALMSAQRAGTVRRVVMTSSIAAVVYGHDESRLFNEDDWTNMDMAGYAYPKSKTMAEKVAWKYMASIAGESDMELAAINPGLVLGPALSADPSVSMELIRKLLSGEVPGCARVGWAPVDVRDIAWLHVEAMTNPQAAGKRFCCALDHHWMVDYAKILKANGYKVSTISLPNFVIRLVAMFDPTVRMVLPELDKREDVDNSLARETFGWQPRGVEEMTLAAAASLKEKGIV